MTSDSVQATSRPGQRFLLFLVQHAAECTLNWTVPFRTIFPSYNIEAGNRSRFAGTLAIMNAMSPCVRATRVEEC